MEDSLVAIHPKSEVIERSTSLEIPRIVEQVRQSLDFSIQERHAIAHGEKPLTIPKSLKKTVKKFERISIQEHLETVEDLCLKMQILKIDGKYMVCRI